MARDDVVGFWGAFGDPLAMGGKTVSGMEEGGGGSPWGGGGARRLREAPAAAGWRPWQAAA